ncbi:MAG: hypothetical protein J5534_00055 [Fibrobacter sp.]|nr:hypothetical protein [Fibrobacter sp.]
MFAEGIETLEKLIDSFEKPPQGKKRFDVFKEPLALLQQGSEYVAGMAAGNLNARNGSTTN